MEPGSAPVAPTVSYTAYYLPGGHIFPLLQDARSCHNLPLHTGCHLAVKSKVNSQKANIGKYQLGNSLFFVGTQM